MHNFESSDFYLMHSRCYFSHESGIAYQAYLDGFNMRANRKRLLVTKLLTDVEESGGFNDNSIGKFDPLLLYRFYLSTRSEFGHSDSDD